MVRAKFKLDRVEITEGMRKRRTEDGVDYAKSENGANIYDSCQVRTFVLNPVYANNTIPSTKTPVSGTPLHRENFDSVS